MTITSLDALDIKVWRREKCTIYNYDNSKRPRTAHSVRVTRAPTALGDAPQKAQHCARTPQNTYARLLPSHWRWPHITMRGPLPGRSTVQRSTRLRTRGALADRET